VELAERRALAPPTDLRAIVPRNRSEPLEATSAATEDMKSPFEHEQFHSFGD
jgi:hypothetical protein